MKATPLSTEFGFSPRPRLTSLAMTMARFGLLAFGLGLLFSGSACGPRISEARLVPVPPRAESCPLEFVKLDMMDLSSANGTWQLVGHVILRDIGKPDPFSEEMKSIVRPRACRMGGEGVTLMMSGTNEGLVTDGTAIDYGVLRHRVSGGDDQPKAF